MAKGIYIDERPRPLRTIGNILIIGFIIGFIVWNYQGNTQDPAIDIRIESIVSDWKQDINSTGLDADDLIKRVDRIKIVDRIPIGLLNGGSTTSVIGRSDHSTRTIWILNRDYESYQLKALVYHELGHYIFGLDHTGDGLIMSLEIKEESNFYINNWSSILPIYLDKCKNAR